MIAAGPSSSSSVGSEQQAVFVAAETAKVMETVISSVGVVVVYGSRYLRDFCLVAV